MTRLPLEGCVITRPQNAARCGHGRRKIQSWEEGTQIKSAIALARFGTRRIRVGNTPRGTSNLIHLWDPATMNLTAAHNEEA